MKKISPQTLKTILADHEKWLASHGKEGKPAELQGAHLQGAKLEKITFDSSQLRMARLLPKQQQSLGLESFGPGSSTKENKLRQQAEENQRYQQKIAALEQKIQDSKDNQQDKDKLNQELNAVKAELEGKKAIEKELEQLKQAQSKKQEAALDVAINHISKATTKTETMLEEYNRQSCFFIKAGVGCYIAALVIGFYIMYKIDFGQTMTNWYTFTPTVLLSFLGTALFRHDWKIRQLAGDLVAQQNLTDTATGVLKAALTLKSIDDMPDSILEDSFKDVRSALLPGTKVKTDKKDDPLIDSSFTKAITK